ncbi:glycosyl transferase family 90 [Oceanospirillum sp.]|uniref:glycosyl transferase family 90 n=1 Tax=Oceanospirillum sp. TaxID=2021254 RepID=UPI003A8FB524
MKRPKVFFFLSAIWESWFRSKFPVNLEQEFARLSEKEKQYVMDRVNYYIKIDAPFHSDFDAEIGTFKRGKGSAYYYDMKRHLANFDRHLGFSYLFGDITHVPDKPCFVKSRPIGDDNQNSVLLKINSHRHFRFFDDPYSYEEKQDLAVWRGNAPQPHRKLFLDKFSDHPMCDVGSVEEESKGSASYKPFLSPQEQMRYKFIVSLEGYDVASNLKWVMATNSVAVMPEPHYETWFMEGRLIPDFHYICVMPDYSDLEEKLKYFLAHPEKAKAIVANANAYVKRFREQEMERLIFLMVLQKYFKLSQQTQAS